MARSHLISHGNHCARRVLGAGAVLACCLLAGCRHKKVSAPAPPPPPIEQPEAQQAEQPAPPQPVKPSPRGRNKALYTEVGLASWYGAPYHNRRGANGEIYNQNALTAAHRTLPLGSVARITNLSTRQSAVVTITDRGPFVPGRMLDLSRAAAIKTGVYREGVARVRMVVLHAPKPIDHGGLWCVQIGAFSHSHAAVRLRDHLQHKYPTANVIEFTGPTGHWVRIRPQGESHRTALLIARNLRPSEGNAYLVRLD
ncbi:MAG: septal ring lytic transglycosylase RlpA family protein [Acidobacteriaceae bacterium]